VIAAHCDEQITLCGLFDAIDYGRFEHLDFQSVWKDAQGISVAGCQNMMC